KWRKAGCAGGPVGSGWVSALVVLPAASRRSVFLRTSSGWWLISTMPPALSVIGPKVSMARMYAAVASMPMVATAVPKSPAPGMPTALPIWYDPTIASEITMVGTAVHASATAIPVMMLVAAPGWHDSA